MAFFAKSYDKEKCAKYCSIIGAHLAMAPLSYLWMYGNLSEYMESYFRLTCSPDCMDGDSQWILSLYIAMGSPGILVTKLLVDRIGLKWAGILSGILFNAAPMFGSAWTVNVSVAWTTVLLGVVFGLGQGLTLSINLQLVSAWAPERAVIYMSTITGTGTALSVVVNQLITAIVNPKNLKPDALQGARTFFSQREVLDRVPTALITYATMILGLQIVGYLLVSPPPKLSSENPSGATGQNGDTNRSNITLKSENNRKEANFGTFGSNDDCEEPLDVSNQKHNQSSSHAKSEQIAVSVDANGDNSMDIPHCVSQQISLKPSEALKTLTFYAVFLFGVALLYALELKANYYKQFALLYIHNDRYLTLVGTLIPVAASVSRISFGILLNKGVVSIKDAIVFSLSVNIVLCSFWYFVPQVNPVLYMVFILCLACSQSLYYAIIPAASIRLFGPLHFSTNYGLLLSSCIIMGILSPIVISPILHCFGWQWVFASSSIMCAAALIFVLCADFNVS